MGNASQQPDAAAAPPARPPPRFIITGFGEFCGVTHNPTQALVEWLRDAAPHHHQRSSSTAQYSVDSLTVLNVSAAAVDRFMQKQQGLLLQQASAESGDPRPLVMLHLGVDTQRAAVSLELQAFNNANFSCADQAGWQPKAHLIEAAPGLGISSVRTTTLPLEELEGQLQAAGFDCSVSRDAGRFVCNYTYYKSLALTSSLAAMATAAKVAHWPCVSLFVHVPSFEVMSEEKQRQLLLTLLDLVARWVGGGSGGGGAHEAAAEQQPAVAVM